MDMASTQSLNSLLQEFILCKRSVRPHLSEVDRRKKPAGQFRAAGNILVSVLGRDQKGTLVPTLVS